jgi:hypothetical protein
MKLEGPTKRELITAGIGLVVGAGLVFGWGSIRREDVGHQAYRACYSILNEANEAFRHVGDVDPRREWELLAACLYAKAGVR